MTEPSQLYRLIEERLPYTLPHLIEKRRPGTSWRAIAREIEDATGISVSWQTLSNWFAHRIQIEVTVS
jgi:hypothetical protein